MDIKYQEFINVVIRIRPSLNVLEESWAIKCISSKPPVLHAGNRQSYTFNGIFTSTDSQEIVYNNVVKPLIEKVLLGYNCTVFAYGQSGTGKTYTIGSDPKMYSDAGFIVRSFDEILTYQALHKELEVYMSFYEIYNDKVYDLLSANKTSLQVKGFRIEKLKRVQVQTKQEIKHYIHCGSRNRHVGETKLNTTSSRSHAICILYCKQTHENYVTEAKLNLVDLAGSENVRKTGNEGSQFQEGVNINIGLFNVRRVISALSTNKTHVPYRESMITTVLQDSLSKTNFVTLVACISPDFEDLNETIQTLEFAQGAKKIKNQPEANNIIEQYKKENPTLFNRPLTNSTLQQRITPLKFQNRSMECPTTSLAKKPKMINHTWTPVSTIAKPHIEDTIPKPNSLSKCPSLTPIPESNIPSTFPPLTPIVLKCFQLLENTWTEKLTTIMKLQKVAEKRRTPEYADFSCQDMQSEVSKIVQSEIIQMCKQRSVACSSPINDRNSSGISLALSDDALPIARRLRFDDVESKLATSYVQLRRSARLSNSSRQLTNGSKQVFVSAPAPRNMNDSVFKIPCRRPEKTKHNNVLRRSTRLSLMSNANSCDNRRQSLRVEEKKRPRPSLCNNLSKLIPTPAPRAIIKDDVRKKHVKNILSLLNYGSEKDMQTLPCIGPKTAKQISFYREFNGRFNHIRDLNEIGWRGSGYQTFLKSNFLL